MADYAKTRDFGSKKRMDQNYSKEFLMPGLTDRNMFSNHLKSVYYGI